MNAPYDIIRRTNQLLVAGADLLKSPLLLALRLYFFWQLFLTGQGKLSNIGKVSEFFASLHIPLPTLNAYFIGSLECFGGLLLIIGLASRPLSLTPVRHGNIVPIVPKHIEHVVEGRCGWVVN
jgi:DoxX